MTVKKNRNNPGSPWRRYRRKKQPEPSLDDEEVDPAAKTIMHLRALEDSRKFRAAVAKQTAQLFLMNERQGT